MRYPFSLPAIGGIGLGKLEAGGSLDETGYGNDGAVAICHNRGDSRAISDFNAGTAAAQIAQFVSMFENVYSISYARSRVGKSKLPDTSINRIIAKIVTLMEEKETR